MLARLLLLSLCWFVFAALCSCDSERTPVTVTGDTVLVSAGVTVSPEGKLGAGEWRDADTVLIPMPDGGPLAVLVKHDTANLLLRFNNVNSRGHDRYPLVLVDPDHSGGSTWQGDEILIEVTTLDCEARGSLDSLDCAMLRRGWFANNFPSPDPGIIELKISAGHLGLDFTAPDTFGLALGVRLEDSLVTLWPAGAELGIPAGWGLAAIR